MDKREFSDRLHALLDALGTLKNEARRNRLDRVEARDIAAYLEVAGFAVNQAVEAECDDAGHDHRDVW
jgi:hypothetical protein